MDDNAPDNLKNLSAGSAASLRNLEQRAKAALTAGREPVSRLEAEITAQLEALSATLADERTADSQLAADLNTAQTEIERLSEELETSREAWLAERTALEQARDELSHQVAQLRADDDSTGSQLTADIETAHAEIGRLNEELENSREAWRAERTTLEQARDEISQQVAQLRADEDSAGSQLTADLETARAEIERLSEELETSREAWLAERTALEQARDELSHHVAQLRANEGTASSHHAADLKTAHKEVERVTQELENSRVDWLAERTAMELAREQLSHQVAKFETNERAARDEWKKQLEEFEQRLREQQSQWNVQRGEWDEERTTLEQECDGLQQKFELALQDVQRLRGRVAELEQELARRPEASHADSAELVALRAERDALSERVEQLERQPAPQIDADAEQQVADLQRRFELAVEDVRELKTANSKLEARLAAAGKATAPVAAADGGDDWESQKRRLLASLEDEGECHDEPVRQKERANIEGTIEMTDAVVAEKDREIAELKSQLASGGERALAAADDERQRKLNELVDADEVVAEHRKRVAQLERETVEKLRAAELELSLERAKIARERVELDELRSDLQSQRQSYDPSGAAPAPGAPRRRWLSKLGLSGDEQ